MQEGGSWYAVGMAVQDLYSWSNAMLCHAVLNFRFNNQLYKFGQLHRPLVRS